MSAVREQDILLRSGGACVVGPWGVPWRRFRRDGREIEAPTFARADSTSCATYLDQDLALRRAAAGKLRLDWLGSIPSLLLEPTATNLCLQSEDFGTTWTVTGSPTRSAAAVTLGGLSLDLLGDDGATAEGYIETFAPGVVTTGTNALSVFAKAGTIAPANGSTIAIEDLTAGVLRLEAKVTFAAGVPTVTIVSSRGTSLFSVLLVNGIYRLGFATNACVAANTHTVRILPAGSAVAADTGNIYVGGVQLENAAYPTSYIKTTTVAVTRAVDALDFPIGFAPQDLTIYLKVPRPAWADLPGAFLPLPVALNLGDLTNGLQIYGDPNTRLWAAEIDSAAGNASKTAAIPAGSLLEVCAQFSGVTTGGTIRLDVGSGFGSASSAAGALSTFPSNKLTLGNANGATRQFGGGINKLLICRGLFTLAECQAVGW